MKVLTAAATGRRATSRRLLAAAALAGTAAAVAGLGTYGAFTDSTSVGTAVTSGVLDIDVATPGNLNVGPIAVADFYPGDSLSRAVNLRNNGNVDLASMALTTTASPSGPLVSDTVNGLQLTLRDCSQAWKNDGTAEQPNFTCNGTVRTLYSGPAVTSLTLSNPLSLTAGREDKLVVTLSLPATATDAMQGQTATVTLGVTGVQRVGTAR